MNIQFKQMVSRREAGASLIVVLILLLVMTLLGLAVLRSTLLEERMSANLYDRSLAFQASEDGLREAEAIIRQTVLSGGNIGFDCRAPQVCAAVPFNAYTGNVPACVANQEACWINGSLVQQLAAAGIRPQYYVEFMGERDTLDILGQDSSANATQYGGTGGLPQERLYRVTARSHNPAAVAQRAVVVLQSNIAVR